MGGAVIFSARFRPIGEICSQVKKYSGKSREKLKFDHLYIIPIYMQKRAVLSVVLLGIGPLLVHCSGSSQLTAQQGMNTGLATERLSSDFARDQSMETPVPYYPVNDRAQRQSALENRSDMVDLDQGTAKARYLCHIEPLERWSLAEQAELGEILLEELVGRVRGEPEVMLQDPAMSPAAVRELMRGKDLRGFILTGSVLKLERKRNRVIAKLGLNVFSNPGYSLVMAPTMEGSMPVARNDASRETEDQAFQRTAKVVLNGLITKVFEQLENL